MLAPGDYQQILEQRRRQRAEVDQAKRLQTWPETCPVCFSEPGERCLTRTGKRAVRHTARALPR